MLSGVLTQDENNILELSYPSGLTKDNCVIISAMLQNASSGTWGLAGGIFNSASYISGSIPFKVSLLSTKIMIQARNINIADGTDPTVYANSDISALFNYKIVLMKIN